MYIVTLDVIVSALLILCYYRLVITKIMLGPRHVLGALVLSWFLKVNLPLRA